MMKTVRMAVLSAAVALAMTGLEAATADAAPSDPGPAASCIFKLSAPSVINVGGTDMVAATITPGACTGLYQPNSFTVCVELQGDGTPKCNFRPVFDPVTVYFAPYRKGATYVATGRGCGNVFPSADESCSSLGPYSATL